MDISVKDLIVKTDRPAPGPRDLRYATALASASPASIAAFNDLLGRVDAAGAEPADRIAPRERPAPVERTERRTEAARPQPSPRDAEAPRDSDSRDAGTVHEAAEEPVSGEAPAAAATTDTADAHATGAADDADAGDTGATPATVILPAAASAPAVAAANVSVDAPEAAKAAIVTSPVTPADNTTAALDGATAQDAASAPGATAAADAAKRPAPDAGFADAAPPALDLVADPNVAETIKRSLATGKGAGAATTGTDTAPSGTPAQAGESRNLSADAGDALARGSVGADPAVRHVSALDSDSLSMPAALRGATVTGVVAAQDLTASASADVPETQATTPSGVTAASGQGTTPAQATARTDIPNPALGLAAANVEQEASSPAIRALPGTANPVAAPGALSSGTASVSHPAAATPATGRAPATAPIPLDEVAVHIARAAASGTDHISIKLKPAALGHVEVSLELTHDGRVAAVVTADRSDTLDMLARDAKSLERALADAGLKADSGSLQFNLRGESQSGNPFTQGDDGHPGAARRSVEATTTSMAAVQVGAYVNLRAASGGLDIRV